MKTETRQIILKEGFESRTRSFGNKAVTAEAGEPVEVDEVTARLAIQSGEFEYFVIPADPNALPENFPFRQKLVTSEKVEIKNLTDLNNATDEQILSIEGIGDKSLQTIREAAAKLKAENEAA